MWVPRPRKGESHESKKTLESDNWRVAFLGGDISVRMFQDLTPHPIVAGAGSKKNTPDCGSEWEGRL